MQRRRGKTEKKKKPLRDRNESLKKTSKKKIGKPDETRPQQSSRTAQMTKGQSEKHRTEMTRRWKADNYARIFRKYEVGVRILAPASSRSGGRRHRPPHHHILGHAARDNTPRRNQNTASGS